MADATNTPGGCSSSGCSACPRPARSRAATSSCSSGMLWNGVLKGFRLPHRSLPKPPTGLYYDKPPAGRQGGRVLFVLDRPYRRRCFYAECAAGGGRVYRGVSTLLAITSE